MAEDFAFLSFNCDSRTFRRAIGLACLHRMFGRMDEHDGQRASAHDLKRHTAKKQAHDAGSAVGCHDVQAWPHRRTLVRDDIGRPALPRKGLNGQASTPQARRHLIQV